MDAMDYAKSIAQEIQRLSQRLAESEMYSVRSFWELNSTSWTVTADDVCNVVQPYICHQELAANEGWQHP